MKEKSYIEKLSMEVLDSLRKAIDGAEDALSDLAPEYNSDEETGHFAKMIQGMWEDISEIQGDLYAMIGDIHTTIKTKEALRVLDDEAMILVWDNQQVLLGMEDDDIMRIDRIIRSMEAFRNFLKSARERHGVS